jgi:hypothetical protein
MRNEQVLQTTRWAEEEFGHAELGDVRRTARLVSMATQVALRPAGRISEVFLEAAQRQGAYDFLESPYFGADCLTASMANACGARCMEVPYAFIPIDGTSLTLVDREQKKDFGGVGPYTHGARGLKVITAIAVSPEGVPLGVTALEWWNRPTIRPERRHPSSAARKVHEKETQHWLDAIDHTVEAISEQAPSTRLWFQIDREADNWNILRHLNESGQLFTVRSSFNRRIQTAGAKRYLSDALRGKAIGHYKLSVTEAYNRSERVANMAVRVATVTLDLRNSWTKVHYAFPINVVYVREVGTTPRNEKPLEWTLLTNHSVETLEHAQLIVHGYVQRWRIEEFHKTWKSGVCDVESTQLQATAHVTKWATMLAATAIRAERLKQLARQNPDAPATTELSSLEIQALVVLKRRYKSRAETISRNKLTIAQATRWIADLGGYTGKSSGGPPGSTTIARGLERVLNAAEVIESLISSGKMR